MISLSVALVGALFGFVLFVVNLEGDKMGNVWWRDDGFRPANIVRYMVSPFRHWYLWHPALWSVNWLLMTALWAGLFHVAWLGCVWLGSGPKR